ncbi:MAG TPA: tetratricopeptide repeat protein [Candidatus Rifleibacterium sp.]|nr:tetratricopeptide repeat protein [Candidatus Rifleibacterium sp.]HPT45177.1 tetratricopeptide repeat protein [Candidatus Rifleibacterium sp.]
MKVTLKLLRLPVKLFLIALVIPAIFLATLELLATLAGAGYPTNLFCKDKGSDGVEYLHTNYQASKRFFPGRLARRPLPEIMPASKPAGRLRIFLLGESAARGEQLADFSLARQLEAALNQGSPTKIAEVINTGIPAINSWVLREFAHEITGLQPDLIIVFAGHNEFIGPYGPAGISGLAASRTAAQVGIWASSLRLIQVLKGDRLPPSLASGWKGLEMFLQNLILPGSAAIDVCLNNWLANLQDIFTDARKAGVPVIWCRVPVNQLDCPPFASDERNLHEPDRALIATISAQIDNGAYQKALEQLEPLKKRLTGHALLSYLEGKAALGMGDRQKAINSFKEALENDCFRVRTTGQFNDLAAAFASINRVTAVDIEKAFIEESETGIIGRDLIYDHVHLTLKGHYLAARTIFSALSTALPKSKAMPLQFPSFDEMQVILGFTSQDAIDNQQHIIESMSQQPFTLQPGNQLLLKKLKAELARLNEGHNLENCIVMTQAAAARQPWCWATRHRLAMLCRGDPPRAGKNFKDSLALNPFNIDALNNYGLLQFASQNNAEAEKLFLQALAIAPEFARAAYNLGLLHAANPAEAQQAMQFYQLATSIDPGMAQAWRNLANLHFKQGQYDRAIQVYQQAAQACPGDLLLQIGEGNCLMQMQNFAAAQAAFLKVAGLFPDSPLPVYSLGLASEKFRQFGEAADYYRKAGKLGHIDAFSRLFGLHFAGNIALSADEIISAATTACQLSDFNDPWLMQILAAGYLENGQKNEAAGILHRALVLAKNQQKHSLAAEIESNLKLANNN